MASEGRADAVDLQEVSFSFGRLEVLRRVNLQIPSGLCFGFLGPNGSGKSTLIRILVGLLRPRLGRVRVLGQPPSPRMAAQVGYMPQLSALYLELSVLENVTFFAQVYGLAEARVRRARVEEIVRLVELWQRRNDQVMNLSGGMRQRVSLACALVHQPAVLFLDEPTVGLDPELRVTFWDYFRDQTRRGVTLIISSHTMDDAARCDQLAFLRAGQVIARGTPEGLQQAVGRPGATLEEAFLHFARHGKDGHVA
ncbi:MAG: ABC transporter ATP-binding protein [Chloroflexi bacterium]|nr:ABC transporter ATP-binding protein [Chloroflexota bacterium]